MVIRTQSVWQADVARFRAEAEAAASLPELAALITSDTKGLGITAFAMGQMSCGGRPAILYLTTWPRSWMELYAANGFVKDDPAILEAAEQREPFTLDELALRRDIRGNRVVTAAREVGIRAGLIVPIHAGTARGVVSFMGEELRLTPTLRLAVAEKARIAYAIAQELHDTRQPDGSGLSPREREALTLVAQGLEDPAIGAALGITRASAHVYVERAKRRLGAATRAQAVAMALAEGLL